MPGHNTDIAGNWPVVPEGESQSRTKPTRPAPRIDIEVSAGEVRACFPGAADVAFLTPAEAELWATTLEFAAKTARGLADLQPPA